MSNAGWPVVADDDFAPPVVRYPGEQEVEEGEGVPPPVAPEPEAPPQLGAVEPAPSSTPSGEPSATDTESVLPAAEIRFGRDDRPDALKQRRGRGQLEYQVKLMLVQILEGRRKRPSKHLTPHHVGREVSVAFPAYRRPSIGALNAVFERWEKNGKAVIGHEPFRFESFS